MDIIQANFPGIRMRFKKTILKNIVDEIQNKIPNITIRWAKCTPPAATFQNPNEYTFSSFDEANMVLLEKNGIKILESFKFLSGGGTVIIYKSKLQKEEIDLITKILKTHNFNVPQKIDTKSNKIAYIFFSISFIYAAIILFNTDYLISKPFWPNILIMAPPIFFVFLGFLIPIYRKIKKKQKKR